MTKKEEKLNITIRNQSSELLFGLFKIDVSACDALCPIKIN